MVSGVLLGIDSACLFFGTAITQKSQALQGCHAKVTYIGYSPCRSHGVLQDCAKRSWFVAATWGVVCREYDFHGESLTRSLVFTIVNEQNKASSWPGTETSDLRPLTVTITKHQLIAKADHPL